MNEFQANSSFGNSRWIVPSRSNPHAAIRFFCFPYAGGSAQIFRTWAEGLPSFVDVCPVQLPGREMRLHEHNFTRLEPLVEAIAGGIAHLLDKPFALFGHSMGATVAFELARRLRVDSRIVPLHLFVSECMRR